MAGTMRPLFSGARGSWRRSIGLLTMVVIASLGLPPLPAGGAGLVATEPVIAEPGEQYRAFGNGVWFTWTANSLAHPNRYNAFAQMTDGSGRRRLNARGTRGYSGGIDPGSNLAIYQQIDGDTSDLYFFDLDTLVRSKVPYVNSRRWEWNPRLSSTYVMFNRNVKRGGIWYADMWAVRRDDGTREQIGSWRWSKFEVIETGTVGDHWASWTLCSNKWVCRVFVRDLDAQVTTKIPADPGWAYYAPALDEANGLVFFVRSAAGCGARVTVWSLPLSDLTGASRTRIADLPSGIDTGWSASLAPNLGTNMFDLLFYRWKCAKQTGDIWAVRGVSPLPV